MQGVHSSVRSVSSHGGRRTWYTSRRAQGAQRHLRHCARRRSASKISTAFRVRKAPEKPSEWNRTRGSIWHADPAPTVCQQSSSARQRSSSNAQHHKRAAQHSKAPTQRSTSTAQLTGLRPHVFHERSWVVVVSASAPRTPRDYHPELWIRLRFGCTGAALGLAGPLRSQIGLAWGSRGWPGAYQCSQT